MWAVPLKRMEIKVFQVDPILGNLVFFLSANENFIVLPLNLGFRAVKRCVCTRKRLIQYSSQQKGRSTCKRDLLKDFYESSSNFCMRKPNPIGRNRLGLKGYNGFM